MANEGNIAGQHGTGHDAGQSGSGSNDFLKATLLSL